MTSNKRARLSLSSIRSASSSAAVETVVSDEAAVVNMAIDEKNGLLLVSQMQGFG